MEEMQWDVYVQSVNRIMLFPSCMDILLQKLWKRRKKVISNLVVVKYFAYPRASRRILDKEIVNIEKDRVADFYQDVIWLYRPWTKIIECKVCDGCSYELTITYKDNRKRKCMEIQNLKTTEDILFKCVCRFSCFLNVKLIKKR